MVVFKEGGPSFGVLPESGELASLRAGGIELLHRPVRPAAGEWRGGAPWLFPAVGRSRAPGGKTGAWSYGGREYPMPIHGFAMDRSWRKVSSRDGGAVFRFSADEETRLHYPFDFQLEASYQARPSGVLAKVVVRAGRNIGEMPFSFGCHLTLSTGGDWRLCRVASPAGERQLLSEEGFLTGETVPARLGEGIALGERSELGDAVLGGFPRGGCRVEYRPARGPGLRVTQRAFPEGPMRFVLWAGPKRDFFCVEPWYGAPNSLNDGRGAVRLGPRSLFLWEMELEIL